MKTASVIGASASSMITGGIKAGAKGGFNAVKSGKVSLLGAKDFVSTVNNETKEGRSLGASLVKGSAGYLAYAMAPQAMLGMKLATGARSGAVAAIDFRKRRGHQIAAENHHNVIGRGFQDTNAAQTMRQAATQQIQANKMNARSALGGEARIFSNKSFNQHTRPYL